MNRWLTPVRVVPAAFLVTITIGTVLLSLPMSTTGRGRGDLLDALFTSVSAVCVTGLTSVDTATYWTPTGQAIILALIQVGGFGIMTLASVLLLTIGRNLGLRNGLIAQTETHAVDLGDVRSLVRRLAVIVLVVETVIIAILVPRFRLVYDDDLPTAVWHAVFHGISAFNNAGFALYSDNLVGFVDDPWIMLPLCLAVVIGGLGFPVVGEIVRRGRRRWSVHTRITVYGSLMLLVVGVVGFGIAEWSNPATIGGLDTGGKLIASVTGGVMPRTAGFNSIDYSAATSESLMLTNMLMFIGGGSAGTAGGIKVSTFILLGVVIWSELRGEQSVGIYGRAMPSSLQRQALTVALLAVGVVMAGTMAMMITTDYTFEPLLFESVSAFATVGLSTGITFDLPASGEIVLILLMFVGRVGVVTVGAALALSHRHRRYTLPEEHIIVG
ncbi:potassium uptake protein, TrkH family [Aeromicrobium marinum DSM 15272]|uniref:Potassium uptake protein, TrkH family n=1 Tax=Aeromicrobium marinum DSM 15272 TaxID=585531 RepID=E2SFR8_9ACTN|nr:potassium transporter TrkG [Aeromicrobium marinum]EFQ81970.1 potassium uptake protein, TrkH family [Aeromicrobium marinum DSM 15272]